MHLQHALKALKAICLGWFFVFWNVKFFDILRRQNMYALSGRGYIVFLKYIKNIPVSKQVGKQLT